MTKIKISGALLIAAKIGDKYGGWRLIIWIYFGFMNQPIIIAIPTGHLIPYILIELDRSFMSVTDMTIFGQIAPIRWFSASNLVKLFNQTNLIWQFGLN